MGKRKLHNVTYYQCDWSGLAMRSSNCYMPSWSADGKFTKYGSYANWECVVAHNEQLFADGEIDLSMYSRRIEYINNLCHCPVQAAPHFSRLQWFARDDQNGVIKSPEEFHNLCCAEEREVVAVRIQSSGEVNEVLTKACNVASQRGVPYLTRPYNSMGAETPTTFQVMRKKSSKETADLTVFYWPEKNGLPLNTTATQLFKMQIYGDVLLLRQTKESSFLPRERFVNFTLVDYTEQCATKRKRTVVSTRDALTTGEFEELKAQMKEQLASVEHAVSSSAEKPEDMARAAVLPDPSGRELAKLVKEQQKMRKLEIRLDAAGPAMPAAPMAPQRRVEPMAA